MRSCRYQQRMLYASYPPCRALNSCGKERPALAMFKNETNFGGNRLRSVVKGVET